MSDAGPADAQRMGASIRARRKMLGMTLVQLAERAALSHPFVSQVERGMARPSLDSLGRIAVALGTSQIELLSGSAVAAESPGLQYTPARSASGVYGTGEARILASGNTRFTPFEVTGSSTEFGHYYEHEEDEFVHVVLGTLDIDLGSDGISTLGEGDSLYLPGGIPHRWASHNREPYRLFVVKERRSRD